MADTPSAAPAAVSTTTVAETTNPFEDVQNAEVVDATEEIMDDGSDLAAEPEVAKAAKSAKRKYKLKVDGEDFEEEFDASNEEEVVKALQLRKVANKRMGEKAQIEKDMRQLLEILKNDPDSVLQELGIDPDEHAKKRLQRKLDEMQKSPEQKEKEKFEAELKAAKEEADKLRKDKEQSDFQRMQDKYRQQFDVELDDALSGDPDMPKNSYVIKRITDLMIFAMENKMPGVKVKDIVPIVKQEIYGEWQQMFDNFTEDQLEKAWGKKNIDRVRKALLKKQRTVTPTAQTVQQTGASETKSQENQGVKKEKMKDFFSKIGKL